MPKDKDPELPKQSIPAANIPDLKQKDKERKKVGAAWGGARPAGGRFAGASAAEGGVAGARAAAGAARAAASAARAAAAAAEAAAGIGAGVQAGFFANLLASLGGALATLTSTLLGKLVAVVMVALMAGGAGVLGMKLFLGRGPVDYDNLPNLGGVQSSMRVRSQSNDTSLNIAASANSGTLADPDRQKAEAEAAAAAAASAAKAEEAAAAEAAKAGDVMDKSAGVQAVGEKQDKMAHNLSGAKLSSSVGGKANFGGSSIFGAGGGLSNAPRFSSWAGKLGGFISPGSKSGKGGTLVRSKTRASSGMGRMVGKKVLGNRNLSSRTLARLRGMAPYNAQMRSGARASETNAAAATSQWEASDLLGASAPTSPTDSSGDGGGGGGGGGGSGPGSTPQTPYSPTIEKCNYEAGEYWDGASCTSMGVTGENVTPWQALVSIARTLLTIVAAVVFIANFCCFMFDMTNAWCPCVAAEWFMTAMDLAMQVAMVFGVLMTLMGVVLASLQGMAAGQSMIVAGVLMTASAFVWTMVPAGGAITMQNEVLMAVLAAGAIFSGFL